MMFYQPQGTAFNLSAYAKGLQGLILAGSMINVATGVPLNVVQVDAESYKTVGVSKGKAIAHRKNLYLETEVLPAIGTDDFVQFFVGYPRAGGARGNDSPATGVPSFIVGSSKNATGIFSVLGDNPWTNSQNVNTWGAVYHWDADGTELTSSGDILVYGQYVVLLIIRNSAGMQFWRNGVLVKSVVQSARNYPAQAIISGSFIEDKFWTSDCDTIMAGQIRASWTADMARFFSNNPYCLFNEEGPEEDDYLTYVSKILKKPLRLAAGNFVEMQSDDGTFKPLVLFQGQLKERTAAEGVPVILDNGGLRTLASTETIKL